MSKLKWDQIGEREYQTGCDHAVLYPVKDNKYDNGVAWSGITNITESPSGAEDNAYWADNQKYFSIKSAEELGLSIECYTYPEEWSACNGESELVKGVRLGQQRRIPFGLSYRTKKGNDTEGEDYGYILHLVYGCSASPSEQAHETINDSPEPVAFSYDITTTPVQVSGKGPDGKPYKPVSSITIDSTQVSRDLMEKIESILYGTDGDDVAREAGANARLPLPDELKEIMASDDDNNDNTTGGDTPSDEAGV